MQAYKNDMRSSVESELLQQALLLVAATSKRVEVGKNVSDINGEILICPQYLTNIYKAFAMQMKDVKKKTGFASSASNSNWCVWAVRGSLQVCCCIAASGHTMCVTSWSDFPIYYMKDELELLFTANDIQSVVFKVADKAEFGTATARCVQNTSLDTVHQHSAGKFGVVTDTVGVKKETHWILTRVTPMSNEKKKGAASTCTLLSFAKGSQMYVRKEYGSKINLFAVHQTPLPSIFTSVGGIHLNVDLARVARILEVIHVATHAGEDNAENGIKGAFEEMLVGMLYAATLAMQDVHPNDPLMAGRQVMQSIQLGKKYESMHSIFSSAEHSDSLADYGREILAMLSFANIHRPPPTPIVIRVTCDHFMDFYTVKFYTEAQRIAQLLKDWHGVEISPEKLLQLHTARALSAMLAKDCAPVQDSYLLGVFFYVLGPQHYLYSSLYEFANTISNYIESPTPSKNVNIESIKKAMHDIHTLGPEATFALQHHYSVNCHICQKSISDMSNFLCCLSCNGPMPICSEHFHFGGGACIKCAPARRAMAVNAVEEDSAQKMKTALQNFVKTTNGKQKELDETKAQLLVTQGKLQDCEKAKQVALKEARMASSKAIMAIKEETIPKKEKCIARIDFLQRELSASTKDIQSYKLQILDLRQHSENSIIRCKELEEDLCGKEAQIRALEYTLEQSLINSQHAMELKDLQSKKGFDTEAIEDFTVRISTIEKEKQELATQNKRMQVEMLQANQRCMEEQEKLSAKIADGELEIEGLQIELSQMQDDHEKAMLDVIEQQQKVNDAAINNRVDMEVQTDAVELAKHPESLSGSAPGTKPGTDPSKILEFALAEMVKISSMIEGEMREDKKQLANSEQRYSELQFRYSDLQQLYTIDRLRGK